MSTRTSILVYADWISDTANLIGVLHGDPIRGNEHFSFEYTSEWLKRSDNMQIMIDPELQLFDGVQHAQDGKNFRVFLDSCPDTWGRLLMKRREAIEARRQGRPKKTLSDSDYLLGVCDQSRMGALRFKLERDGPFLEDDTQHAAPPMAKLRELEHASSVVENDFDDTDPDTLKWLSMLMAPGTSLGGARPKASVVDDHGHLWIAKFPSGHDEVDVGAWEYVAYKLALDAKVTMSECRIEKFASRHNTFLTKRFDRDGSRRIHFSSAMTQLGYYDGVADTSYLEIAEFLANHGSESAADLEQLWRRIIFNIAITNADDHLRNHGFILDGHGWRLSPAYDLNPNIDKSGLHLNIDDADNSLDYDLAFSVIEFFMLTDAKAELIFQEVLSSVMKWRELASHVGISRAEQSLMEKAFNIE